MKDAINASGNFKIDSNLTLLSLGTLTLIILMYFVHDKTFFSKKTYAVQLTISIILFYTYNHISSNPAFAISSNDIKSRPSLIAQHETPISAMVKSFPIIGKNNIADRENIENHQIAKDIEANKEITFPSRAKITINNKLLDEWNYGITLKTSYKKSTKKTNKAQNKNVILIILESIRSNEISHKDITPNLKNLINESIYFDNFYSTNITTVKSEHAILCGVPEISEQAPYSTKYSTFKGSCLPKELNKNGYSTLWLHGNTDSFFNRKVFHKSLGFEHILGKEHFLDKGYNPKNDIGWGIPDTYIYDSAIDILENVEKPFFAEILTLTSHHPFNWKYNHDIPKSIQYSGNNNYNNYLKAISYSDYAIGEFIKKFKESELYDNTILIITGDHGIQLYENKLSDNEKVEMLYKVPLIIHYKGIKPSIYSNSSSHLDLPATILDILGLEIKIKTLGLPLHGPNATNQVRPIYMMNMESYNFKYGEIKCYQYNDSCSVNESQNQNQNSVLLDAQKGYNYMKIMQMTGYKGNTFDD